jgi:hypothetical protein
VLKAIEYSRHRPVHPRHQCRGFSRWIGNFESVEVNSSTGTVRVQLAGTDQITPEARLRVEQPAKIAGVGTYRPVSPLNFERNAYTVPLGKEKTWVKLGTGN